MTAAVDEKAGYCTNCRAGSHSLCGSAKCTCPDMRKHRNRPGFAGTSRPPAGPSGSEPVPIDRARAAAAPPASTGPTFRLVKKDPPPPPEKPRKLTLAERLEQLLAGVDDSDWYSVVEAPTSRGASQLRSRCAKVLDGWEFRAAGSEVYARRAQEEA